MNANEGSKIVDCIVSMKEVTKCYECHGHEEVWERSEVSELTIGELD